MFVLLGSWRWILHIVSCSVLYHLLLICQWPSALDSFSTFNLWVVLLMFLTLDIHVKATDVFIGAQSNL